MDDMKGKMKGFMKKMSSSSSGKFKGQGRVLGSGPSPSPSSAPAPAPSNNPSNIYRQNPTPVSSSSSSSSTLPTKPVAFVKDPPPKPKTVQGFDPYDSLITTGKRSQNGYTVNVFECPICNQGFKTEEEVSEHVETCVNRSGGSDSVGESGVVDEERSRMEVCVGGFLSGSSKEACVEVVRTLFRNVVKEPENGKFRRIRMSNPRIREAVGDVAGGVELLELVGFELWEESGEMWAVMEVPDEKRIGLIKKVIELLGPKKVEEPPKIETLSLREDSSPAPAPSSEPVEPEKFDRQV